MPKNQLFKINPDLNIISQLLSAFGLENLEDSRYFTREYLRDNNVVEKLMEIKDNLEGYYLPCKKKCLQNLTEILQNLIKI